jgi:hypothetical protein
MANRSKLLIFLILNNLLFISWNSIGQTTTIKKASYLEYIKLYAPVAIREMKDYKIPASITLSQALIESGAGKSELAVSANNHFGIKCHQGWKGETYTHDDDAPGECFRKYKSADESFRDHSLFLTSRPRYVPLFSLDIYDYKAWAMGLKKAGYATNPRYAEILIKVIEDYELYKYDRFDGKLPARERKQPTSEIKKHSLSVYFLPDYVQPKAEEFTLVDTLKNGRKIYMNNGLLFVFAEKDDSFLSIANAFNKSVGRLARYNEMKRKDDLVEGQIVYLEKKKLNGIRNLYVVRDYDTWFSIAQFTGVNIKALKELNIIDANKLPNPGIPLNLKGEVRRSFFDRLFGR